MFVLSYDDYMFSGDELAKEVNSVVVEDLNVFYWVVYSFVFF